MSKRKRKRLGNKLPPKNRKSIQLNQPKSNVIDILCAIHAKKNPSSSGVKLFWPVLKRFRCSNRGKTWRWKSLWLRLKEDRKVNPLNTMNRSREKETRHDLVFNLIEFQQFFKEELRTSYLLWWNYWIFGILD